MELLKNSLQGCLGNINDVSSTNVIKIIGESTDGAINFIWIPPCFKNTGRFYFTLMKKVLYVYRSNHFDILI